MNNSVVAPKKSQVKMTCLVILLKLPFVERGRERMSGQLSVPRPSDFSVYERASVNSHKLQAFTF